MFIKQITPENEIKILEELVLSDYLGKGSSRISFALSDISSELTEFLIKEELIDINYADDFVIKVALGVGGQTQMKREIDAYIGYGDNHPLARIFSAGVFVEIMEFIDKDSEDCDFRDLADYYFDSEHSKGSTFAVWYGFDEELNSDKINDYDEYESDDYPEGADQRDIDHFEAIVDVLEKLSDLFGDTGDNGQIGYNSIEELKCYDYGFLTGSEEEWGSQLSYYAYNFDERKTIIENYIDYLTNGCFYGIDELENNLLSLFAD